MLVVIRLVFALTVATGAISIAAVTFITTTHVAALNCAVAATGIVVCPAAAAAAPIACSPIMMCPYCVASGVKVTTFVVPWLRVIVTAWFAPTGVAVCEIATAGLRQLTAVHDRLRPPRPRRPTVWNLSFRRLPGLPHPTGRILRKRILCLKPSRQSPRFDKCLGCVVRQCQPVGCEERFHEHPGPSNRQGRSRSRRCAG